MHNRPKGVSGSATSARAAARTSTSASGDGEAPHVLIADGNAESRSARETQVRAAGARVSVARTGFEAIVKASCHVPDVILLDDALTDMETADAARLLATCPVTAHITIVTLPRGDGVPGRVLSTLHRRWL